MTPGTDQLSRELIQEAPFSVAARVAMQLGRESISNSIIAIIELVKNAYDAEAESVSIRFGHLESDKAVLVIEDTGDGMSFDQLMRHWMVIGTSNKLRSTRSAKKQRVLTGEKGLGRLGLDRLCKKAVVRSFAEEATTGIELDISWIKYEGVDANLEDIKHSIYKISKVIEDPITKVTKEFRKGTQLVLEGLKDSWTKEFLLDLKQELTLLVSPFAGLNDFMITIDSGSGFPEIDGPVGSSDMSKVAEWQLKAEITDIGETCFKMDSPIYKEKYEQPPTAWKDKLRGPVCGPLTFQMYFFPRRPISVEDLNFTRNQIDNFLDANQGIRIYRDGFRVKPFGQPNGEGDWLKLSYRRQQSPAGVTQGKAAGGWRVGYNQVVGAVFLERDKNIALIDQTNREGIVEGPAFYDLKSFVLDAVRFFELNREKFERNRKEETNYEKAKEDAKELTKASQEAVESLKKTAVEIKEILTEAREANTPADVDMVSNMLANAVLDMDNTITSAQEAQEKFAEASREQEEEYQRQKDTLANLASLGILTASFGHETIGSSNIVLTNATQLKRSIDANLFFVPLDITDIVNDNLRLILYGAEKIETFAKFTLKNVTRDKRKRKGLDLGKTVDQVLSFFSKTLKEKKIEITPEYPTSLPQISAFEIDWESIIVNLITNSVWALEDTPAGSRFIRIRVKEIDGYLEMTFADSGRGLEPGTHDKIFLPTFSTKRNDKGEVVGTGMGLTIVKSFVEDHEGGSVEVKSPSDLNGAEFIIKIPIPKFEARGNRKEG